MVAEVLIEYSNKLLDKTFGYIVPFNLQKNIKIGHKVKVEFGKRIVEGFVLDIKNEVDEHIKYKEIISIVNEEFVLSKELLKLGYYIKSQTSSNLISCLQVMLPKALKAKNKVNINIKYITYLILVDDSFNIDLYINEHKRNISENKILNDLKNNKEILKNNYNLTSVKSLIKKNIIKEIKYEKNRLVIKQKEKINITLNNEQNEAYKKIINTKNYKTFLLYGVTGSGKTEIYIKVIDHIISKGKTAILLVPEISLTPQITERFVSEFGDNVAILHSRLSEGEKYDEYRKILKGEVKIVVGARSAVFAPLKNLGIIIIDEEHSASYKQDNNPRYNAIDVAKKRCELNDALCILGSATPLLETYARAKKGVYELLELKHRVNGKLMPKITLIDSSKELKKRNFLMSGELINKINDRLNKNEQVIILLNRRGFSTFISCSYCGYVFKCPNCSISLTYHKINNTLRCHYCGYTTIFNDTCPSCKEKNIKSLGIGTEKLEELIKEKFPNAKVIRMDIDTTSKKGSHEKIINDFKNHKYDILVGTQMISKGLNFPLVTLVGVLQADLSLNIPDFRSSERTFELLTQTAGRSGRNSLPGEVIIETFNPDNYVLKSVENYDYEGFFNKEMFIRKKLKYPPYYYITNIRIVSSDFNEAKKESIKVKNYLINNLSDKYIILGPTTASMFKLKNKYRFSIIIKYKDETLLNKVINDLNEIYINSKVNIEIDKNPLNLI